jgi:predicted secreted Zn-dependent protease
MSFKSLCASAVVLATMALANSAEAKDWIVVKTTHYTISGNTPRELFIQMFKRGPRIPQLETVTDKRRFVAATAFTVLDGSYKPCWMKIEANIIMPRWKEYKQASPQAKQEWDDFYQSVMKHEQTHVQHKRDIIPYIKKHKCSDKAVGEAWEMAYANDKKLDASVEVTTAFEQKARSAFSVEPASWTFKKFPEVNRSSKRSILNRMGRNAHHDAKVWE